MVYSNSERIDVIFIYLEVEKCERKEANRAISVAKFIQNFLVEDRNIRRTQMLNDKEDNISI